jgi:hypothetical protein
MIFLMQCALSFIAHAIVVSMAVEECADSMLEKAVASVLSDDFTKNTSTESQAAVESATALLECIQVPANRALFRTFSCELTTSLKMCFKSCKFI